LLNRTTSAAIDKNEEKTGEKPLGKRRKVGGCHSRESALTARRGGEKQIEQESVVSRPRRRDRALKVNTKFVMSQRGGILGVQLQNKGYKDENMMGEKDMRTSGMHKIARSDYC